MFLYTPFVYHSFISLRGASQLLAHCSVVVQSLGSPLFFLHFFRWWSLIISSFSFISWFRACNGSEHKPKKKLFHSFMLLISLALVASMKRSRDTLSSLHSESYLQRCLESIDNFSRNAEVKSPVTIECREALLNVARSQ